MPRLPDVCPSARYPLNEVSLSGNSQFLLRSVLAAVCIVFFFTQVFAQSATATLSGTVMDQNGAVISGVNIAVINFSQGFQRTTVTNSDGSFVVSLLPPATYTVKAEHEGFTTAEMANVILNVNDRVRLDIQLKVAGLRDQTVDIVDTPPLINESPAVGATVDRQFVDNMPLNGRSFQSLITLAPGTLLSKTSGIELGQFSVNGQRADANYFTVDGVSANIGTIAANVGQPTGGTVPGLSVSGGTNNLVSVDALQEFKIQTSTYAPEFGRQPGAQVQIATRAGTNNFHGSLFDYFRNDVFDANDWFNNARNKPKPPTRQNDFGGVLGGPIFLPRFGEGGSPLLYDGHNRTFFFFSYEGLRLRQPQAGSSTVPTVATRQNASPALQPYLSVFPLPNGPNRVNPVTGLPNGYAAFDASFSIPSTLDATSLRIDHTVSSNLTVFARYNHAPSATIQRGGVVTTLSIVNPIRAKTQTLTVGAISNITSKANNDFRFNYSRNSAQSSFEVDGLGGGIQPADSAIFPPFTSSREAQLSFLLSDGPSTYLLGSLMLNVQRQLNVVDSLSLLTSNHNLKLGIDYRRVFPIISPRLYSQQAFFRNTTELFASRPLQSVVFSETATREPVFTNLSLYAQDTWRASRRLTLTYGLRWELNPPPTENNGNHPAAVIGLDNPSTMSLAPSGTPLFPTTYNNFAPRIGVAYKLFQHPGREIMVRSGFGIFYDLGAATAGEAFRQGIYPYGTFRQFFFQPFPLSPTQAQPPAITTTSINVAAYVPNLKLPRTYQWNFSLEQSLGANQTISAAYVGAAGRRLLRQETLATPNPTFNRVFVTRNAATSDYHSAQIQFQRRLVNGLQAMASYTWAKSLDNISVDSVFVTPVARIDPQNDRGPSDFDVRHAFNAAVTYNIPAPATGQVIKAITRNWAIDSIFTARSATPVDVLIRRNIGFGQFDFRPDLVPGIPLYLDDPTAPGGRRFNNTAVPGNPNQLGPFLVPSAARQGTLGRNVLRGFPVYQVDLAFRRLFNLTEKLNLQFKAEFFNIFNHPNFGDPNGLLGTDVPNNSQFGRSEGMWGRSLGTGGLVGGFSPLYQVGGPRSIQLSMKVQF